MEGGLDSSHVSCRHRDAAHVSEKTGGSVLRGKGKGREFVQGDTSPKFEVREVEYGLLIGARRNADDDNYYWRISQWLMPWYTLIPPYGETPLRGHAWVPVDDEHCWVYNFSWHPARPLTRAEITEMHAGGFHFEMTQGTNRHTQNKENNYLIDRDLQKSGISFTGIKGLAIQDLALQESMGSIYDRTKEHLGTSDMAIISARRRLIKAAQELQQGSAPPGLDSTSHRERTVSLLLP